MSRFSFFFSVVCFLQGRVEKKKKSTFTLTKNWNSGRNMTVSTAAVATEMPQGKAKREKKNLNNDDHVSNEHNFILLKSAHVGAKAHSLQGFRGAVNKARRG